MRRIERPGPGQEGVDDAVLKPEETAEVCDVSVENMLMCVKSFSNVPTTVTNTVPVKTHTDYGLKIEDAIKRKTGKID